MPISVDVFVGFMCSIILLIKSNYLYVHASCSHAVIIYIHVLIVYTYLRTYVHSRITYAVHLSYLGCLSKILLVRETRV